MADLFGVMLRVPQLSQALREAGGEGLDHAQLSDLTKAWVNGESLDQIARAFFSGEGSGTEAFTSACKAIYRAIVNAGTWGISALSHVSGIDFDSLSEEERRRINALPAMIYHGVKSEAAVLMRMNAAPRSVAEKLGELFKEAHAEVGQSTVGNARHFLRELDSADWNKSRPPTAALSGADYRRVWRVLSGETRGESR